MFRRILLTSALTLTSLQSTALPVSAQQWGLLNPDGSIHRRGIVIDGPNPERLIQERMILPDNRHSIDLGNGIIRRGGIMQSGPNPNLRLQICMQTELCR